MQIDTQVVEILGRNYLINELLQAGIEVATPVRDSGIDLIAYLNKEALLTDGYAARPIQIKAASARSFCIDKKYSKFPHLLLTFIWHLNDPRKTKIYCLDYQDALGVAKAMGYTNTQTWKSGKYTTTNPSERLVERLRPFEMNKANDWVEAMREF